MKTMIHRVTNQAVLWGCLFTSLFFFGCKESVYKENLDIRVDENGVVTSVPAIWEKDVSEGRSIWVCVAPIFHNDMVIVPGGLRKEIVPGGREAGMLVALDAATGEEV